MKATLKQIELTQPELMKNKTFKKYLKMVSNKSHIWQEREIISFRSYIHANSVAKALLLPLFNDHQELSITPEQQQKGLQWLIKTQLNSKGDLRRAKTTFIGHDEVECLKDFSHFTMTGLRCIGMYRAFYVPVYRLYSNSGRSFEYSASQSGCEVV